MCDQSSLQKYLILYENRKEEPSIRIPGYVQITSELIDHYILMVILATLSSYIYIQLIQSLTNRLLGR